MNGTKTSGRGVKDIDPAHLARLNAGEVEAATLVECLAVDFALLMGSVLPDIGSGPCAEMHEAREAGISRRMLLAARLITKRYGPSAIERLARHSSDTVRGWVCAMLGAADMELGDRLLAIRPFADDPHFGVREWSWMAVRSHLAAELDVSIALLAKWTVDPSERIRRFATEALRPRGVWCSHIAALKQQPERALAVLEPLRADPSIYVQDSVGNWLNDAGKDRPEWVRALCERWLAESPEPATVRICRRGMRSIPVVN
ncbi:DNA alkylation repair protein [Altererythrobacter sp. Root672]|uniref:DNA alkylation repair protein n=1 Tax=Altererythrobacter sp. Root672 TaxID=1736584 RepID=UPI0006FC0A08|nr:DNA alkylation repair protein [Altererythrobacter sp. Root672]KRA84699.1 DNA alkylation repair protein [Altererythrobacter sp. Root672]